MILNCSLGQRRSFIRGFFSRGHRCTTLAPRRGRSGCRACFLQVLARHRSRRIVRSARVCSWFMTQCDIMKGWMNITYGCVSSQLLSSVRASIRLRVLIILYFCLLSFSAAQRRNRPCLPDRRRKALPKRRSCTKKSSTSVI